mgnify:CR=1 FL=1
MEITKDQLKRYSNLLEEWIPKEASIAIAVKDQYIYYYAGEHDLQLQEGQKVQPGSIADLVFKNGCRTEAVLDSHPSMLLQSNPWFDFLQEKKKKSGSLYLLKK